MSVIDDELKQFGIDVVCPLKKDKVNAIADYVAKALCVKYPELKLDYKILYSGISRLPMYIADMPNIESGACYYYKTQSIYFGKNLSEKEIRKVAVHECIHHFQEISDNNGNMLRIGLCTYNHNKGYGHALNEAAVQTMAAYATDQQPEVVTYYGITMPSDSPDYYPLECNLLKQISYTTGASVLFESTFFANDKFFEALKEINGENKALKLQYNFEKMLMLENKLAEISSYIQTSDLKERTYKKAVKTSNKYKKNIAKLFFTTQNSVLKTFFNYKFKDIKNTLEIEEYRKLLFNYRNLIGTNDEYSFFNDFYLQKMIELDELYNKLTANNALVVVKKSKISRVFDAIRALFNLNRGTVVKTNEEDL